MSSRGSTRLTRDFGDSILLESTSAISKKFRKRIFSQIKYPRELNFKNLRGKRYYIVVQPKNSTVLRYIRAKLFNSKQTNETSELSEEENLNNDLQSQEILLPLSSTASLQDVGTFLPLILSATSCKVSKVGNLKNYSETYLSIVHRISGK